MNINLKNIDITSNKQINKAKEEKENKNTSNANDNSKSIKELEKQISKLKKDYELLLNELPLFASNGDFSENADWILTNERKEILSKNIIQKEIQLTNLKNNNVKKQQITYKILETGEEKTFILTDGEIDPLKKIISFESPLGKILNQYEKGNVINSAFFPSERKKNICNIEILEKKWVI